MNEIRIFDRTLTEAGELSFKNRLDLARELDGLGVDILGLPSPALGEEAALLVRTLGTLLRRAAPAVSVGLDAAEAELAARELKSSPRGVLTVSVPVSASGMEYLISSPLCWRSRSAAAPGCAAPCCSRPWTPPGRRRAFSGG